MLKKLLYVAAGLFLLVIIGLFIVFLAIDSIAKSAIEKGGTYALGTETSVSSVSVGVFKGEFSLSGLKVATPKAAANAPQFESPHFLTLGKGSTAVSLSTIRQPTVEIPSLTLADIDAHIERRGDATNYGVILDHLKKVMGGDGSKPAPAPGEEKKFVIRELKLSNITVHVDMTAAIPAGLPGQLSNVGDAIGKVTKATIPIDRVELKDVGKGVGSGVGDTGVTMSQLSAIIVKAVLAAAAEKGGGLIPADLLGDLRGKLSSIASLDALSKGGAEIIANTRGQVEELGKKVGDDLKKGVEDAKKGIGDAIKGVIPGKEKK